MRRVKERSLTWKQLPAASGSVVHTFWLGLGLPCNPSTNKVTSLWAVKPPTLKLVQYLGWVLYQWGLSHSPMVCPRRDLNSGLFQCNNYRNVLASFCDSIRHQVEIHLKTNQAFKLGLWSSEISQIYEGCSKRYASCYVCPWHQGQMVVVWQ